MLIPITRNSFRELNFKAGGRERARQSRDIRWDFIAMASIIVFAATSFRYGGARERYESATKKTRDSINSTGDLRERGAFE